MRTMVILGTTIVSAFIGLPANSTLQFPTTEDLNQKKSTVAKAIAQDGAMVQVLTEFPEDSVYELYGSGFKPHEALNFVDFSYDETFSAPINADANGTFTIGLLPAVFGKTGGVCYIYILREDGSIQIKFPWGKEAVKFDYLLMLEK